MTTITFLSKEEERRRKKKKGEREKEREEEEVVVFVVVVVFKLHPRRIFRNRLFTFSKMNTRRQKWTHRANQKWSTSRTRNGHVVRAISHRDDHNLDFNCFNSMVNFLMY